MSQENKHPPKLFVDSRHFDNPNIKTIGVLAELDIDYGPNSGIFYAYISELEHAELLRKAVIEARAEERNRMLTILQSTLTEEQLDLMLLAEGINPEEALKSADAAIARALASARQEVENGE